LQFRVEKIVLLQLHVIHCGLDCHGKQRIHVANVQNADMTTGGNMRHNRLEVVLFQGLPPHIPLYTHLLLHLLRPPSV
jgi:hypothetical protein